MNLAIRVGLVGLADLITGLGLIKLGAILLWSYVKK